MPTIKKQPDVPKKEIPCSKIASLLLGILILISCFFGIYSFFSSFSPEGTSKLVATEKTSLEKEMEKLHQEMSGAIKVSETNIQTKVDDRHNLTDKKITDLGIRIDSGFAEIKKQIAQNCNSKHQKISAIKPTVKSAPVKSRISINNSVTREEFQSGLNSLQTELNQKTQNLDSRLITLENVGRTNIQSSFRARSNSNTLIRQSDSSQQNSSHPWM
jgi:hypothetical protein